MAKCWKERKWLTLTSGLSSSFLCPRPNSWQKRHCSLYIGPMMRVLFARLYIICFGKLWVAVAKALDLQLAGCEFNSRPRRCRVTTLGKLLSPTCLGRSQWFSDGMIDCGVRGRGQLCLSRQPLRCTGCTPFLQCLGRLSLPPSVGR